MSREIKFRAWDKKRLCWYKTELTFVGFHIFGECTMICPPPTEDLKDIEITQFTGLKDKNGIEIYEGDIVQVKFSNTYEAYEVVWQENTMRFGLRQRLHEEQESWSFTSQNDFEIIGNIYSNPELLERQTL